MEKKEVKHMNDQTCLHEGNGVCKGELTVVENPTTLRSFIMCERHAEWYYERLNKIVHDYPEVLQPSSEHDY